MTNTIKMPKNGIYINEDNKDKLEAYLSEINGRACTYTITSFSELVSLVDRAEEFLDDKELSNKDRIGSEAKYFGYCPSSKSYRKYTSKAITTELTFKRAAGGWKLILAEKVDMSLYGNNSNLVLYTLTDEAIEKIKSEATRRALRYIKRFPKPSAEVQSAA